VAAEHLRGRYTLPDARLGFLEETPSLEVQELGPSLWTASDGRERTVFAEVDGNAIAWDTFSTPGRARAYREAIGREISTIVYSNDHLDRSGWARELAPEAERIAHEWCAQVVEQRGADGQLPVTQAFADELTLGPARLIFPGLTSASGNVATYFPDHGVLYAPDTVLPNARYSMLPDWHIRNFSDSLRSLLVFDFDTFVPGRYALMTRAELERGIAFLEAVHDTAQRAFAESVAVWLFDAMDAYVKEHLLADWGDVEGFDDHVGIMAFRIAHHYLTGGWSTEDTPVGRPQRA
jgi:glyoxylase-like metal-dependent hydrolase (beta-lactamase superfamily II)